MNNEVVTPTEAAVVDMVAWLEQIYTSPGPWYAAIDLAFSSSPVHKAPQSSLLSAFTALLEGYINSPRYVTV